MFRVTVRGTGLLKDILKDDEKKTMIDLHAGLVMVTPVDTGNARAGWQIDPATGEITNVVEYIEALNDGHSQQAPAGFVETEMDRAARRR